MTTIPPNSQAVACFSLPDFSGWSSIGLTKVKAEIASGRLIATKIGRRTVILVTDAEAWLASLPKRSVRGAAS